MLLTLLDEVEIEHCDEAGERSMPGAAAKKLTTDRPGLMDFNMGQQSDDYCRSCTKAVHLIQGKWKILILCAIRESPVRLGLLTRKLPDASKKVLTENLRELEEAELIVRRDYGEALRHVEYDFKEEVREDLKLLLDHLASFGYTIQPSNRSRLRKDIPSS